MPHTTGKPISSSARKHLICPQHMKRVSTDTNMVRILTNSLSKVFVHSNTTCLECLGGDLLLFVTDQVCYKGEEIDWGLFVTNVINTDFGFWYTTAVAGFDVQFVFFGSGSNELDDDPW